MTMSKAKPTFHHVLTLTLSLALTLGLFARPAAATEPVNKSFFGGVAIDGYDPVAYFTEGRPVEGKKEHSFEWKGATWRFASKANLDRFEENPEKYAPQYGGYCAWAVSQGKTAGIDPDAWKIVDGKLYLNYDQKIQKQWEEDMAAHIESADKNWPKMLEEK